MSSPPHAFVQRIAPWMRAILCLALLLPAVPMPVQAAPPAAPAQQVACPAGPLSLPDMVDRTNFCVRYDDADTTLAQAQAVADLTQQYWDRYVNELGFRTPLFSGKLVVEVRNNASCNGATDAGVNYMFVNNGCFTPADAMAQTVGHELFHRVQLASGDDLTAGLWLFEGTARAMEDLASPTIDNWVNAMTAAFSFNQQVNTYLNNTNVDITSLPQRYNSALWWKYFAEQYGTDPDEPERGVDAIVELWEAAETADDIAAVNNALANLGIAASFDVAFRRFVAANWTKDRTNPPDGSFNYIDEEEAGNPAPYGPIAPADGGTIQVGAPAVWNAQAISRYGASYYAATPGDICPVVNATLHTDAGPAFFHVMTEQGDTLVSHMESTAADWSRSFFNNGLSRIVAVAGSTNNDALVDVTLQCLNPTLEIKLPNNGAQAYVGPYDAPGQFLAQVLVTDGSPKGPVIAGFTPGDFTARVNDVEATITTGGFIQEQYWLLIQAPVQGGNGAYNLEIALNESGSASPIAVDINAGSVLYAPDNVDHVLVIDRSGSMNSGNKMQAARDAAKFYVDITRDDDGIAIAPFNQDVSPTPFPMQSVSGPVRTDARNYINALSPGGTTSIGDGLQEAVNQRTGSPTGNPVCSFVLLSDGMENSSLFWSDVQAGVVGSGCPVTTIAFGPETDETLLQDIATAAGSLFFYNDVFVQGDVLASQAPDVNAAAASADLFDETALELGSTYEYAQGANEGRQRLLDADGIVPTTYDGPDPDREHQVVIDGSVEEALFALKWNGGSCSSSCPELIMKLLAPDGKLYTEQSIAYSFKDVGSGHVGWRIPNPTPGVWRILINHVDAQYIWPEMAYKVLVSAHTNLIVELLLPDRLGSRYFTGNRVPIYALLAANGPIDNAGVRALVTAPSGDQSIVPLYDDGQHGDGLAGDGFYAGIYQRVNQAKPVSPSGEDAQQPPPPRDEGSYQVRLQASNGNFQREARGAFSVMESPDENKNGLPDEYERENQLSDPYGDEDLDGLGNYREYEIGTDPQNSDTDGGGENDGSEWGMAQDPFEPKDDGIREPGFFDADPIANAVRLRFDVHDSHQYFMLYRSEKRTGPWLLRDNAVKPVGEYIDTGIENGTEYFYRLFAVDGNGHRSAVLASTGVIPSADPFPPEAKILINDRAPSTKELKVMLSFVPYEDEEYYNDITHVKLGHTRDLAGASWQPFEKEMAWELPSTDAGEFAHVYARFRDGAGNTSLLETARIRYEPDNVTPTPTPTPSVTPDPDVGTRPLENLDLDFRRRAEQFLEEMRGSPMAPGWDKARLGDRVRELFRPDVEGVAYWEFQVVKPDGSPSGFILLAAGDHDFPIAHWNFEGETPTQNVERKAAGEGKLIDKFFKLDTLTYAGEDRDGKLAALVGNRPVKVEGSNPAVLDEGLDLSHAGWRPDRETQSDSEAGGLGGQFFEDGPPAPPDLDLGGWDSWQELKDNFSDTYETVTGALEQVAERDWELERTAREEGEGLFKGEIYSITLISEIAPEIELRGDGVDPEFLQWEIKLRDGLPALLQLQIVNAKPGFELPFEVEIDFGDRRENLQFSILDRNFLPRRNQLENSIFLPLARTARRIDGVIPSSVDAPQAVHGEWSDWTFYWAGGAGDQRLYGQIPSSHPMNTSSCDSGSAATAWAMLFGWADKQASVGNGYWAPRWGLYREGGGMGSDISAPGGMDDGIRAMIWEIRNHVGTECQGDSQPTAPWNMERAANYFRDRSGAQLDTHYSVEGLLDGRLRDYVIESIRDRNTPAVIGTGWLNHYALAYGYAWRSRSVEECNDDVCWEETEYSRLFYINRGNGGAENGWVPGNTWFVGEIRP